jgi:hypothetical protein
MTDWLKTVHDHLGTQTAAIRAALDDVRELCGESAIGWVERPRGQLQGRVTVYVLADGFLHRVSGDLDPIPDAQSPGNRVESTCEYKVQPLTAAANYTVSVTARLAPPHGTYEARVVGSVSKWRFTGLGQFGSIVFESLPLEQSHYGPDPTPFAKALVAEILRIKRGRRPGAWMAENSNAVEGA